MLKNREFKFSLDPSNTFSGDAMDERGNPIVQGLLAKGGPPKFREGQVFRQIHGENVGNVRQEHGLEDERLAIVLL